MTAKIHQTLSPKQAALRQAYTRRKGWQVLLRIDHQTFFINRESDSADHAEWLRDQLAIALGRIKS